MPLQLKETLQAIKPKRVFPIQGAYPELFSKSMNDLTNKITIVVKRKNRLFNPKNNTLRLLLFFTMEKVKKMKFDLVP